MMMDLLAMTLPSCKTSRIDSSGNKTPTKSAQHMQKIHPHGMWTLKGYVNPIMDTTKQIKK